ncbi:nucleoside hydrolase [Fusibacter paucivorans]|uniref:Nucleoside hydrolase n=1 Tax=Fusibacter paucivorans TaxID=76009 RepID=A0ABS5PQT5_9FIRM|nr:nucleoside hydrolase [Fusibacter paucivorans]MBS7527513.1 nucleoside hydrolase [Fusibacter paucivorans]
MSQENRKPTPIILDCDPGHDDAIAIMLAGGHPAIDLKGITVVAGNQTLEKTVNNALNVCQHLAIDVPVFAGCDRPMVRAKQVIADDIHGETGLDGPVFAPRTKTAEAMHAVMYIIETLKASVEPMTLVATGPLTNYAMALRMAPDIIEKIDRFVIMGGSLQHGNVTPAAEFNILADAEAAHIVFSAGKKVVMVGLDVTRKVLCLPSVVEKMRVEGNVASKLFVDLMSFFNKTQKEVFGWEGGPLHDPVTIAYLINPSILELQSMVTEIDYSQGPSYGRTNCDLFGFSKEPHNSEVAMNVDVEAFWQVIREGIACYE